MFLVTALFLNTAKSKQELENAIFQTAGIAQKYNCMLKRLDYQQEEGLMSSLPLGVSNIPIKRARTTTSTAIFVPFTTQELFMGGDSLYYGLNATSNNLIMVDRKKSKNPNGLILGTPGSGKSFAAKREMTNVFFTTNDDIILQSRNERMFLVTALFLNTAKSKQELENAIFQTAGIAQKYNCMLKRLDYQQEEGLMSSLPLGVSNIPIKRARTTTSTAIFVPFTTQELFMGGDSLYYGLNATSNNLIMVDRKKSKNPNGLILGTPGSGKSFAAKREMTNVFFTTNDDIIIGDPEGEYYPLVHALGGQVIHISPNSKDYINPMDINMNYSEDDNPLGVKSDFILSLCELIMGSRDGIEAEEKSVIDRCLPLVYQNYFSDPKPENMPILGDLYDCLRKQKEPQAQRIATALEIYVNGSLKVFNHQTNVELNNRIVCFDIKELGKQLKKLGMLIIQDQVWNRLTDHRGVKSTWSDIDDCHLRLKEEQTAT